ncbi:hypothetical protein GCM10023238_12750 [Streptomyces heliomycini]
MVEVWASGSSLATDLHSTDMVPGWSHTEHYVWPAGWRGASGEYRRSGCAISELKRQRMTRRRAPSRVHWVEEDLLCTGPLALELQP